MYGYYRLLFSLLCDWVYIIYGYYRLQFVLCDVTEYTLCMGIIGYSLFCVI